MNKNGRPKVKPAIEIVGSTVIVPLTKGYQTVVDLDDLLLVETDKWFAKSDENGRQYASRIEIINDKRILFNLHRLILERKIGRVLTVGELPDHVDNDPLNNRRSNLRIATHSQNQHNAGVRIDNTSGYRGVSLHKQTGRWQASIQVNKRKIYLGLFETREEARDERLLAAQFYHGEFNNG